MVPEKQTRPKKPREVQIALAKGEIWIKHGFHPHFQKDLKEIGGIFHNERASWSVSIDKAAAFQKLVELYFQEAIITDHRKPQPKPQAKPKAKPQPKPKAAKQTTAPQQKEDDPIIERLRRAGYVIRIHKNGPETVKYAGVLWIAHEQGLKDIRVESQIIDLEQGIAVFKATVTTDKGIFEEWGDCTPYNVSKNIKPHFIRVAATRAKARALRDAVNVGFTCFEEMDLSSS